MAVLPAYLKQFEQKIQSLLIEKKFNQAYGICIELLNKYPQERKLIKLKARIEQEVASNNQKIIKKKLNELKPLWKEEKYDQILAELQKLLKASPNNENLKRQILKAQSAYQKKVKKLQGEFEKNYTTKLDQLLKDSPEELIEQLFQLEKSNPGNGQILALAAQYRDKLIEAKIKEKEDLVYSDNFKSIENFIATLEKIDPKNKRVSDLKQFYKSKQGHSQIENVKEFVFNNIHHLDTLMKLKKYDKAMKLAKEILEIEKGNKKAQKTLKAADKKYKKVCSKLATVEIQKQIPELKKAYESDKKSFVQV